MANAMLPKQINPIQLADNQKILKGELQLSEMERLREVISSPTGIATVILKFGRDILGYAYIKGNIQTGLEVICQRCNSPMKLDLNIGVSSSPVGTDKEAKSLPSQYEPLLLTEGTFSLSAMVEEEILLSIPIVPKHAISKCKIKTSELIEWEEEEEKSNPFEVLKKLLRE